MTFSDTIGDFTYTVVFDCVTKSYDWTISSHSGRCVMHLLYTAGLGFGATCDGISNGFDISMKDTGTDTDCVNPQNGIIIYPGTTITRNGCPA